MNTAQLSETLVAGALEIRLSLGGNGSDFVGDGWSTPEEHGCWTVGYESYLQLKGLDPRRDYLCWLPVGPFLHPPELIAQHVRVTVNGFEVFECTITCDAVLEFSVPANLLILHQPAELVLQCSNPTSPSAFLVDRTPPLDGRQLGLSVWGVRLTPKPESASTPTPGPWMGKLPPPPRVAAVTMVYNEAVYLPIWLAHNARQVGIENCYVIDHGSTDGSTENLGACNVLRIPRSPYDPAKQSRWNSEFCSSLLTWFDWVIYSDVDEILMADPAIAPTLVDYCRLPLPSVVTAIGLNTLHLIDREAPLDLARPISEQRPYVFGCASMCKPLLIKRRVKWSPGSHSSDAPLKFDHLYMFHLRWFDREQGLNRLHKTRAMAWAQDDQGQHQRLGDDELGAQMRGFGNYPLYDGVEFNPASEPLRGYLDTIIASTIGRENDLYKIDLGIWYGQLWRLPERFVGMF